MALAIVGIPGIGSDPSMYDAMNAAFATPYPFIGWNLPGYGGTELKDGYAFADLARWLADDLDARGVERAHILGHSIGGMVAMEFALTYPERVASLLLSATTPMFGSRDGSFQRQFLADRLAPLDNGVSMAELAAEALPPLVGPQIAREEFDKSVAGMARVPEAAFRAALYCIVTFNRRKEVEGLTCPVLLLAGEHDRNAPLATMQRMNEYIPNSEICVFANTGHMAPIEVPGQFAAAIERFLSED